MIAKLVALVLPLGLDTLAVAAALGALGVTPVRRRRISVLFTAFETGMPLVGLALGARLGQAIGSAADDVAIAVLLVFGLYTMAASDEDDDRLRTLARLRGPRTLLLGLSISLDELAVGFALGLLGLPVALVLAAIAVQTVIVTQIGLRLGDRLGSHMREGAERLAGVALAGLGVVLLAEKLLR